MLLSFSSYNNFHVYFFCVYNSFRLFSASFETANVNRWGVSKLVSTNFCFNVLI